MERGGYGNERDLSVGGLDNPGLRCLLQIFADTGEWHADPPERLHRQKQRIGTEVKRVVVRTATAVETESQEIWNHGWIHRAPRSAAPGRRAAGSVVHDRLEVDKPRITAADPFGQRLVRLESLGKALNHERIAAGRDGQGRREKKRR